MLLQNFRDGEKAVKSDVTISDMRLRFQLKLRISHRFENYWWKKSRLLIGTCDVLTHFEDGRIELAQITIVNKFLTEA